MEKKKKANIVLAREFISRYYELKYNTISNRFEYKEKSAKNWEELNENEILIKLLFIPDKLTTVPEYVDHLLNAVKATLFWFTKTGNFC